MFKLKNKKGDFSKTESFFTKSLNFTKMKNLDEVGKRCIERLKEATPVDTGITAESWKYEIIHYDKNKVGLLISNTNIENGMNIALLLEYGHGTNNGAWIEGKNYIDPIIREEYNKIMNETWKEIERL